MFCNVAQTNGCIRSNSALIIFGLHTGKMSQHFHIQIVVVQFRCQMNNWLGHKIFWLAFPFRFAMWRTLKLPQSSDHECTDLCPRIPWQRLEKSARSPLAVASVRWNEPALSAGGRVSHDRSTQTISPHTEQFFSGTRLRLANFPTLEKATLKMYINSDLKKKQKPYLKHWR